jgi:hypothetical protein
VIAWQEVCFSHPARLEHPNEPEQGDHDMANSLKQNPSNKVGRNSGAGPDGVSRINPTERELERGLELPVDSSMPRGWLGRAGAGLGAAVLLGAGAAGVMFRRAREQRSLRGRLRKLVNRFRR